jgi:hypothetical protein
MHPLIVKDQCYKQLLIDKEVLNPDLGNVPVMSILDCAVICTTVRACTTFNMKPRGRGYDCQLSNKKGTCMERYEARKNKGWRMFERRVNKAFSFFQREFFDAHN